MFIPGNINEIGRKSWDQGLKIPQPRTYSGPFSQRILNAAGTDFYKL